MGELSEPQPKSSSKVPDRMDRVSLARREYSEVQQLAGFKKKTHHVPDGVDSKSQTFVRKLAAEQIRGDLDHMFRELRSAFRFKRTEIECSEWEDGSGSITTPFFRYSSVMSQSPDDATGAIWERDISEITVPEQLIAEPFAAVFGRLFDTVEFTPPSPIDLEALIDRIEDLDDERVLLDYDRNITFCEIAIANTSIRIHVTPDVFRIVHPKPTLPRELIASLLEVQNALVDFSTLAE